MFTKNRERHLAGDIAAKFLAAVLDQPRVKAILSDGHFSVDGTLIEAWAGMESFKPEDDTDGGGTGGSGSGTKAKQPPKAMGRNSERDFHYEKRSNATEASTTDPDARLYKKARRQEAKLCHMATSQWKIAMVWSSTPR